jgi:hypothetical protein
MHKKLTIALCLLWAAPAAATAPSIDSSGAIATHIANASGQSSISAAILTTQNPDLAVLDFYAPAAGGSPAITTIDGCNSVGSGCTGALTWKRRYQYQTSQPTCGNLINIPCLDDTERWTAVAASTVSATVVVALNMPVVSAQVDTYGVFALFDVNNPYDPLFTIAPLEAENPVNVFSGPFVGVGVTVNTQNTDDLVLAVASSPFWVSGDGFIECGHIGGPIVFTGLVGDDHTQTSINPQYARLGVEYRQFAAPIVSTPLGFSNQANPPSSPFCVGPYKPWVMVLDVMTGSASGGGGGSAFPHVWVNE